MPVVGSIHDSVYSTLTIGGRAAQSHSRLSSGGSYETCSNELE